MYKIHHSKVQCMRPFNQRVCGYPEVKPRDNRKRVGYTGHIYHTFEWCI